MGLTVNPPAPANAVSLRYTLTSSGTLTIPGASVSAPKLVYLILVGGGGGGSAGNGKAQTSGTFGLCTAGGSGGSAGNVVYGSYLCIGPVPYTIGTGGTGATALSTKMVVGNLGGTTTFGDITAFGGFGGSTIPNNDYNQVGEANVVNHTIDSDYLYAQQRTNYVNWTTTTGAIVRGSSRDIDSSGNTYYAGSVATIGSSGSGPGGGAGYNVVSGQSAGTGVAGGAGGTAGGLGSNTGAATGWVGANFGGISAQGSNFTAQGFLSNYAGGGGGGGGGGTCSSTTQRAGGAGGAATLYGGAGGNGGNGGAATGGTQQAGVAGSNATGYGAGGGGGGGLASGNTLAFASISVLGGNGGNGSQGVIYVFY